MESVIINQLSHKKIVFGIGLSLVPLFVSAFGISTGGTIKPVRILPSSAPILPTDYGN